MQPNNNDPMLSGGQAPGTPQGPGTPDWQRGLDGSAVPGQSINPTSVPAPEATANGGAPQGPAVPDGQQGLGAPASPAPSATPGMPAASQPAYGTVPDVGMATAAPAPKRGLPKPMIAAIAVVAVLVLGTAGYVIFARGSKPQSANHAAQTSANNAKKSTTALNTLTSATLLAPVDMSEFQGDTGTSPDHDFLTTGSDTTNGGCELGFGTDTAAQLPGTTIDEVVTPGINTLKNNGVTVVGPKAGTAITLKDAAGKEYSLPTITYSFTQGAKHGVTNYSLAITKDGNRTYVRRSCALNGTIDSAKMNLLEQKASQITVTTH